MRHVNLAGTWKKRLAASLLPLSLLSAMAAGGMPQGAPWHLRAAAAQEQAAVQAGKGADGMAGEPGTIDEAKKLLRAQYGENRQITEGRYDKSLAVKCVNGTFVGKKTENIIAYRGIPFAEKPLRWQAPREALPDTGIYEAYYNAKSAYGNEQLETGS